MMAARSRAFIAGSGWPSLAATVISRASLLNSFDFWASCRPLRCMMFLNWECPAMRFLLGFVRNGWVGGWKARPPRAADNIRAEYPQIVLGTRYPRFYCITSEG